MRQVQSSVQNNFRLYRRVLNTNRNIFEQVRHVVMHNARGILRRQRHNVKFYITGKFIFEKALRPGVFTDPPVYFNTSPLTTTSGRPIEEALRIMYQDLTGQINEFIRNGSGWSLRTALEIDLRVATYDPTRASSYLQLPEKIRNSKSVLNIRNDDDKCALWCILAHLFPKHNRNDQASRISNPRAYEEHLNDINTDNVQFPLQIRDVGKLEYLNNLSVNIFTLDSKARVIPIRISNKNDSVDENRVIDLLYIVNGVNTHYCLITNLAGLCRPQQSSHCNSKYLCRRCLHFCASEESYKNHIERCANHDAQKTTFPRRNDPKGRDKVRFTQVARQLPLPFYFVADFECVLEKLNDDVDDGVPRSSASSSTTPLNKHVPCGAAYKISCTDPRFYRDPVIITHDNNSAKSVAERFLDSILHDAREIREMLKYKVPMQPLTLSQLVAFHSEHAVCHICKKWIDPANDVKCADHDHLTGLYRGPTHQACNINYRIVPSKIQIPCFFHNLKNYDAHLLISAAKSRHGKIKCIPNTAEKYIAFSIGDIVFKDSLAMTQASLDSLAKNLSTDKLINTRRWLENSVERNTLPSSFDMESSSLSSDDSMSEDEPTEEDIRFINDDDDDDNPMTDGASPPPPQQRRAYFLDNEPPSSSPSPAVRAEEDIIFVERDRRHRMTRRRRISESDVDGEEGSEAAAAAAAAPEENNAPPDDDGAQEHFINDDDDAYYFNDENGVYVFETNHDDADDGGKEMAEFDYRRAPYTPPSLTSEERQLVDVDLDLIKRKGVYPYEYMDSFDRFKETEIPPIEAFNSALSGSKVTRAEYAHANQVFRHFGMKSLQDYHNLYLLQDILLLDDILLSFRKVCMSTYGLDPLHYYTAPGLTWDAGLKYTRVTLDLLTEQDKFMFVEDGIRGGISMISHRHAKANHPDLPCYDESQPLRHLLNLDANNLYGWAMMQHLPVSDFAWMLQEDVDTITLAWILSIAPDAKRGYIFEVDIHTPKREHSHLSDYPLAPEKKSIDGSALSPYQREILKEQFREKREKQSPSPLTEEELESKVDAHKSGDKLILDFEPKTKYAIHYRNLQLYLKLGMKITRIHRVLCFKQKAWLEPYIRLNTEMRQRASNDFEKNFYKLMNNAFFGKTMENVRKRRHIDIVSTPTKLKALVAQPTFKSFTPFNEDIAAVERLRAKVYMSKPIYVGLCVLDLSKWLMYDFYYNALKKLFPQAHLLFTDTDSLCVSIEGCDDVYKRIREATIANLNGGGGDTIQALDLFDFSGYSSDHPLFQGMDPDTIARVKKSNKKVPGRMKDELDGNILLEFVGLRAKAYAFEKLILFPNADEGTEEGEIVETKKLKGVQKCVVKKNINFDHYLSCLFGKLTHYANTTSLRSFKHEIRTLRVRKIAMTPYDDKRYLLDDGITSLPYGHVQSKNIYR